MAEYYSLEEAIQKIEEPNRSRCKFLLEDNRELFAKARGSKTKHQAWEGGYLDHVTETMNIALLLYDSLHRVRPLPFSLSDALLVLFLHDLEKPWKQANKDLGLEKLSGEKENKKIKDFRNALIKRYCFELTSDHENAIKYAEGEGEDYSVDKRIQGPLAAFVHMCDVWSARGWYDHPKRDDSWKSAR